MRILFLGDIVGHIGIAAVSDVLPLLRKRYAPDFVIANGENATRGRGLSESDYKKIVAAGVDCITLGNHYHDRQEIDDYIDSVPNLIRPLNLVGYDKGQGSIIFDVNGYEVQVTNVMGKAYIKNEVSDPVDAFSSLLEEKRSDIHIVDFHAESTSEKQLFAYYFDSIVTSVIGTHTHVQTNDAFIMNGGTSFISDVGYCGAFPSLIGFEPQSVIDRILHNRGRMVVDDNAKKLVCGAVIDIDEESGLTTSIASFKYLEGKEWGNGQSRN